ncbi:cysteine proteinase [Exidia glandulosa HHB12029]|uniref:Cysteine proteinase n=1 Tax=Exidia glandulosa HHB12029 TaxID=1314781 RepID=A0A166BKW9_EXIGL|nr:cysteine proteinase [Exidia glandulosa HHB12029]
MEKALRKARETLRAPRPPLPFHPSYDELLLKDRRRDSEIDDRIRPKKRPLPSKLPPAAEKEVDAIFAKNGPIAKCAREAVNSTDISRMRPGQWLNDEIINFYGAMILERSTGSKENHKGLGKLMKVHYFSTFFWPKLNEGYAKSKLNRWTKKIDIFSKDVILIPVNHGNAHWTAAAINFRRKRIESYDSMGMKRANVLSMLRKYLELEHQDKRKKPFDFTGWTDYVSDDTPQQENCYDCGVFTCQFLETLSRGEEDFAFTQKDMPYLRRRMVWEIGRASLMEQPS